MRTYIRYNSGWSDSIAPFAVAWTAEPYFELCFFRAHLTMEKTMFRRDASRPLLLSDDSSTGVGGSSKHVPLYDPLAMMQLNSSICQGYITLLTGACEQAKGGGNDKEAREKALMLAFASLADGNVIDVCFGMRLSSKENSFATTLIKEAKSAIDETVTSNERIERVAVDAYKSAFQTVIDMNKKLDKLNIFTACFLEKKIRRKTTAKLENDFLQLEQAVTAAM